MTHPTSIRARATIKFKEPIPEGYIVGTDESFTISINGKEYQIDFSEYSAGFEKKEDRSILEVEWKEPDTEAFPEVFDALTLDVLKNGTIKLIDNLDTSVVASNPFNDEATIEIEKILDLRLVSPYDEFEDVNLLSD